MKPMNLYSGTFGYGANCHRSHVAAESDEQAIEILFSLSPHFRACHKIRKIGDITAGPCEDEVDKPGPVVFRGWGPGGAVKQWDECPRNFSRRTEEW